MPNSAEYTALRQIMYQPTAVWLATENCGDRWLTDQYVLINVTAMDALTVEDPEAALAGWTGPEPELPDGPYKLTASNGFQSREGIPEPDIERWFTRAAEGRWRPVKPSEWSVAEHPGKAMLWACGTLPCLLGESTWTALKRHHPECEVSYEGELNMFRFAEPNHDSASEACATDACLCSPVPFCYAAGIRVPDGQYEIATAVAAYVNHPNNYPEIGIGS